MISAKARFERQVGASDWITHPGHVMRFVRAAFVAGWMARDIEQCRDRPMGNVLRGLRRAASRAWEGK